MMKYKVYPFIPLLWIFSGTLAYSGCTTKTEMQRSVSHNSITKATYTKEDTGIVFVIMKIYSDSVTHYSKVVVEDKIYKSGHIKSSPIPSHNPDNYLTCILYDGDLPLDSVRMDHPLYRRVEYFEEGGKMGVKEINQRESEFSVRFQLKGKKNKMIVFETLNHSKPKELITVRL